MTKKSGSGRVDPVLVRGLLAREQSRQREFLKTLQLFTELESPSEAKGPVDLLGALIAKSFAALGATVTVQAVKTFGDHLDIAFEGTAPGKPVMLLGHFDTVWEVGTLERMPFRVEKGRVWGPGVYDMKCGIVMMLHAIAGLKEAHGGKLPRPVRVRLVTDEEVGSDTSRAATESAAKQCAAVLVCEPSQGIDGAIKTWRKGVGSYQIKVAGKASHSGVDFEKGQSAVIELARQVLRIAEWTDVKRGLTLNPGVISGGTRVNVIAAEAQMEVDVRIMKLRDAAGVDKKFRSLKPFNKKCVLEVSGGINRPPMERSDKVLGLYRVAEEIGKAMKAKVREEGTGGGSDGNFTAALGIPTLDGLGAVGEGAHALHESVMLDKIAERTAMLGGLIASV